MRSGWTGLDSVRAGQAVLLQSSFDVRLDLRLDLRLAERISRELLITGAQYFLPPGYCTLRRLGTVTSAASYCWLLKREGANNAQFGARAKPAFQQKRNHLQEELRGRRGMVALRRIELLPGP